MSRAQSRQGGESRKIHEIACGALMVVVAATDGLRGVTIAGQTTASPKINKFATNPFVALAPMKKPNRIWIGNCCAAFILSAPPLWAVAAKTHGRSAGGRPRPSADQAGYSYV